MLPTFVIGLREGLEASLIVGIIAAFLAKQGRRDLLRWMFVGVGTAIVLCVGVGVALRVLSNDLPQRQQEGLETVIGALAVGMVTYMVVWMRRHSRQLKGQLESMAADALHGGARGTTAMIFMAFLAVLREGFETVVFLLAAFNESTSGAAAGWGALIGIVVAAGLGYAVYRGGVRLNLSKFFRATGLVLVLVAAGLVLNALHTAHEAGWLDVGQGSTIDLSGLVRPGSVQASLLTGMLGLQPHPVVIEVVGWLLYLVPVGLYVGWPPGREPSRRTLRTVAFSVAAVGAVTALVLALARPARPARPSGPADSTSTLRLADVGPTNASGAISAVRLHPSGGAVRDGLATSVHRGTAHGSGASNLPTRLSPGRVAALNGGRLPLGTGPVGPGGLPVTYTETARATVWTDERTGRLIAAAYTDTVRVVARLGDGALPLARPLSRVSRTTPSGDVDRAVAAARADRDTLDRRTLLATLAGLGTVLALVALATALMLLLRDHRNRVEPAGTPERQLVRS